MIEKREEGGMVESIIDTGEDVEVEGREEVEELKGDMLKKMNRRGIIPKMKRSFRGIMGKNRRFIFLGRLLYRKRLIHLEKLSLSTQGKRKGSLSRNSRRKEMIKNWRLRRKKRYRRKLIGERRRKMKG